MAGIKEIRTRIASVTSTRKITSAMKMVSAAKLRKAQNAVIQMRPYSQKLDEIYKNVSSGLDSVDDNVYGRKGNVEKVAIILVTSNSGLCGAFNTNVAKQAVILAKEKYSYQLAQGWVDFYCVGKKGAEQLKSRGFTSTENFNYLLEKLSYEKVAETAVRFMDAFEQKKYDSIEIIYNKFKNAASQVLHTEHFLPIEQKKGFDVSTNDYIFEPSKSTILKELIPKTLKIKFYNAILESIASEHGARMTAMHKATDNATEFLKALKLEYNKARQASITNEILEIVSGANALKGS
jgi:F-type H+-transporting ATPase subunit gamma